MEEEFHEHLRSRGATIFVLDVGFRDQEGELGFVGDLKVLVDAPELVHDALVFLSDPDLKVGGLLDDVVEKRRTRRRIKVEIPQGKVKLDDLSD